MAAPTSTNEVTVRRLSSVITQLWAKIKDTFAPKSHTHSLLKFGNKTYNGSSEQTITADDLGAESAFDKLPYSKGGTNASSQKGAEYNLNVAGATQLTSDASDDLRILFATASPSSSNGIIAGYRKCSQIWSYIKGKLSGSDVNIGGSAKNVEFVKNMYFNTSTYALDIKIPNVRTAGTTFLIQMCQNNGNVCVLELSLWRSSGSAITGIKAVLLYCNNYDVSELPKDVFYSTSATGDNHVYLASNSTATYSTSFSILYNSEEIAEDRTSSITFGTVERATARGNTQLTVRASGIPRLTGTAVGSSSNPVYVNDYGLLTECGNLNAATATNAEGLTKNGYGRFRYLSHSGSNALVIELGAISNYASILICSSRGDSNDCWPVVFCISFNWSGSSWSSTPKTAYLYTTRHSDTKYSPIVKYSTNSGKIYIYYGSGDGAARLFYSYQGSNAESVSYDVITKTEIPSSGMSESAYEANVSKTKVGTAIGSTSKPVYVQANGFVAECGTIANSEKWNGYKIDTSGTIGSDTSTIYFA